MLEAPDRTAGQDGGGLREQLGMISPTQYTNPTGGHRQIIRKSNSITPAKHYSFYNQILAHKYSMC